MRPFRTRLTTADADNRTVFPYSPPHFHTAAIVEAIDNLTNVIGQRSIFLVVASGGGQPPAYEAKATEADAWALAEQWHAEGEEGDDAVDVLRLDLPSLNLERLHRS